MVELEMMKKKDTDESNDNKDCEKEKEDDGKDESAEEVTVVLDERQKENSHLQDPINPCIFVIQTPRPRVESLTAELRACLCF